MANLSNNGAINWLAGAAVGGIITGLAAWGIHLVKKDQDVKEGMQCGMKAAIDCISDATAYVSNGQYTSDDVRAGLNITIGEYNKDHPGMIWRHAENNYNRLKETGDMWSDKR